MSERRACRLVNQPRGTQRYQPTQREDEDRLTQAIIVLASQYGRYGYRRITALLRRAGWRVGKDRAERIWRREGLKVPKKQKPRGRLWLNDGSCLRLWQRSSRPDHGRHPNPLFARRHRASQRSHPASAPLGSRAGLEHSREGKKDCFHDLTGRGVPILT